MWTEHPSNADTIYRMKRSHIFAYLFACALFFTAAPAFALEIKNPVVASTTPSAATIKWTTDINADSLINYGLDTNVGTVRYPQFDRKSHTLTVDQLDPSTTYHFRVISADKDGNRSATAGLVFTTKADDAALAKKIKKEIKKIKEPEPLKEIIEEIKEIAEDILKPPTILGAAKVIPGFDEAEIIWTTDRDSSSVVYLAPEGEYNPDAGDPYTITQGDPNDAVQKHSVTVIGLEPSTEYHFKIVSEDSIGLSAETLDDTFRTKSVLPQIKNAKVSRVQETSAQVSWNTGEVKAKGIVEYTNMRSKAKKSVGNPVYLTSHSIQLANLEFGTRYQVIITSTNEGGDNVQSDPFYFITVRDVIEPVLSKVKNESTLYPGEDVKIQTIVSWETDEPAFCQTFYSQGLIRAEGDEGESLPKEPNPTTAHTQVVVGFSPATVYKFWMKCADEAGNETQSEDFVLITPVKEKSIIDIILENFEGTFGWVKNIGG